MSLEYQVKGEYAVFNSLAGLYVGKKRFVLKNESKLCSRIRQYEYHFDKELMVTENGANLQNVDVIFNAVHRFEDVKNPDGSLWKFYQIVVKKPVTVTAGYHINPLFHGTGSEKLFSIRAEQVLTGNRYVKLPVLFSRLDVLLADASNLTVNRFQLMTADQLKQLYMKLYYPNPGWSEEQIDNQIEEYRKFLNKLIETGVIIT